MRDWDCLLCMLIVSVCCIVGCCKRVFVSGCLNRQTLLSKHSCTPLQDFTSSYSTKHGGTTTTAPDVTYPLAICPNPDGGGDWGGAVWGGSAGGCRGGCSAAGWVPKVGGLACDPLLPHAYLQGGCVSEGVGVRRYACKCFPGCLLPSLCGDYMCCGLGFGTHRFGFEHHAGLRKILQGEPPLGALA